MFSNRLSVTWKLFAAIALTTAIIVGFMAVMIAVSMRSGFSQHLLQVELDRFDELASALAESYDPESAGWPKLAGNTEPGTRSVASTSARYCKKSWSNAVTGRPIRGQGGLAPPDRVPPDPLQLGRRLALLDTDQELIAGPDILDGQIATRPIETLDSDGKSVVVGWLALAAPEGGSSLPIACFSLASFGPWS